MSLRNLSVVSRKESASTKESMINNVSMGVRYATEALELDPNDGTSWYIMGNAFISSFFSIKQSGKTLMKAMDAYNRAVSICFFTVIFYSIFESYSFFLSNRKMIKWLEIIQTCTTTKQ